MMRSTAVAAPSSSRPPRVRSAVTNGALPGGVRGDSAQGRRFADIVHDLADELGGQLTPAEVLQVRTIAGLVLHAEAMQAALLKGEAVDSEQLVRVSNAAARLIVTLRKGRAAKPKAAPGSALAVIAAELTEGRR